MLFIVRPPPSTTLFPYTTLFRSVRPAAVLGPERRDRLHLQLAERGALRPGYHVDEHQHPADRAGSEDRKSTRLNSSHTVISYAVFCLKKKKYLQTVSTSPDFTVY